MTKIESFTLSSARDGLPLSVCAALPEGEIRALVQLAHGMAEHKERYLPFMEYLAENGYASVINDHRGHGGSVRTKDDLGYFYQDGPNALVDDLHQLTLYFKGRHPGKKLFLFGHSMGSLAVRAYRQRYDGDIDGLVVCGSPGQNPATGAGLVLNRLMTLLKGERYRSPMFTAMTTGGYSKAYPNEGSANAWLSANPENVRRYDADPLCGFPFTLNGYRALLELLRDAYRPVSAGNPELPVHFISGAGDPCAPDRKGFEHAVQRMKADGYRKVTSKLYEGMRHEILNETDRQTVYRDLLALFEGWMK